MPSNSTRHTIARQWQLLKLLPTQHPGTTSTHLHRALSEAGHSTSKRTIERDLNELSTLFPLRCNDKGTPFGWYLLPELGLQGLEPETLADPRQDSAAPRLELYLWVNAALASQLRDAPLSPDMHLRSDENGGAHLWATLAEDANLMAWLLAHAGALRIKRPHALRTAMLERLQQGLALNA
ncbi:WYL domain-containing protein [Pseudomonas sp. RP23018S]|uniref:WYL domain-containing protein n=1 Tax=Pseudomonas sp. RP23018S TaxID=3096037 RepID=UPI002ACA113B|nr:WYL domain-containing protein [Pseudomonas sp. RP23018S]MDZ5603811.1 WYL domain-containing protein [Pseudomonas sp. RP23018S]